MSALVDRYRASSPHLAARLSALAAEFPSRRAVVGDGNCFYRGFLFGLLEALLAAPHEELRLRWVCWCLVSCVLRVALSVAAAG
jgi:hypothetical protein